VSWWWCFTERGFLLICRGWLERLGVDACRVSAGWRGCAEIIAWGLLCAHTWCGRCINVSACGMVTVRCLAQLIRGSTHGLGCQCLPYCFERGASDLGVRHELLRFDVLCGCRIVWAVAVCLSRGCSGVGRLAVSLWLARVFCCWLEDLVR